MDVTFLFIFLSSPIILYKFIHLRSCVDGIFCIVSRSTDVEMNFSNTCVPYIDVNLTAKL